MNDQITPGERRELRSVIRQQFKVLKAEVLQRKVELESEVEQRIAARYHQQDELQRQALEILERAQNDMRLAVQSALRTLNEQAGTSFSFDANIYGEHRLRSTHKDNRTQDRKALIAGVLEQVRVASLQLDRDEADLLRALATDSLESDEARGWLGKIPTVAELVPDRRLREIEAALGDVDGADR